ncbi:MAG: phosphotyrosine protein phosphatase [Pseudomonadota bacterium]
MTRALFICGKARRRSPTAVAVAERVFGLEAACAGLSADADEPLDADAIEWADAIFVMEARQKARLKRAFGRRIGGRKIVSLDIPDRFEAMAPDLTALLEAKLARHFGRAR